MSTQDQNNVQDGRFDSSQPAARNSAHPGIRLSTKLLIVAALIIALLSGTVLYLIGCLVTEAPSAGLLIVPPEGDDAYHKTVPDEPVRLKAVVRAAPGTRLSYRWMFGDESEDATGAVDDLFNAGIDHAYEDAESGDQFTATLTLTDRDTGDQQSDDYSICFTSSDSDKPEIAVENGLWALHASAERRDTATTGRTIWWEDTARASRRMRYVVEQTERGTIATVTHAYLMLGHGITGDEVANPYADNSRRGVNSIVQHLKFCEIESVASRHPDSNGNDQGIHICNSRIAVADSAHALLALCSCRTPSHRIIAAWRDPDNDDSLSPDGLTHKEVVQELVDYLAFAQNDADETDDAVRGGWNSTPNANTSDMLLVGDVALALSAAEVSMGVTAPEFVKEELAEYLKAAQQSDGGFEQQRPRRAKTVGATAAGIIALSYCSDADVEEAIDNAEAFISENWEDDNVGNFPTMYAVSQASLLAPDPIRDYGSHNWRKDYKAYLLHPDSQDDEGFWHQRGSRVSNKFCSTAAALLILKEKSMKR